MTGKALINNETEFNSIAKPFLDTMFDKALKSGFGDIEIRTFPKDGWPSMSFCETSEQAVNIAYDPSLVDSKYDSNPVFAIFGPLDLLLIVKIVVF